ncbi:acyl-CoA dehydrogenase family protein [Gordonia terrae]|uniref:acyl-CoA dehydrogenase family protein n=1 Tax=Gordonia hongkongensis TaxID=1701090 RepID=UPI0022B5D166|nr:acyl-CoA dehydrogenase family protein [Gordonia terrae]
MTESLYPRSPITPAERSNRKAADELLHIAREMRPKLRKTQAEHERLGGYSEEIHRELHDAGFYNALMPKRYGGLELELDDFFRIGVEISRGDPGVGWSFILGAGHSFHVGSFFSEEGQAELFGNGPFIAPGRTIPSGKATTVDGGFRLSGRWDYCSGSMWSTHVLVVAPAVDANGDMLGMKMFVLPRASYTILDDWGGDRTIGMRASSSNSVEIVDAFVPNHLTADYDVREHVLGSEGTVGYELHGNPTYLGRSMLYFNAELVATQIGAAWAALDEFEELMKNKAASFPPRIPRTEAPEYHRWFGKLLALTDGAEAMYMAGIRQYVELGRLWHETGRDFTTEDDARLRAVIQQSARMANEAVELAFTTAGTTSAKKGSAMEKYYRDVAMYKTHIAAQWDVTYGSAARYHFGLPLTF